MLNFNNQLTLRVDAIRIINPVNCAVINSEAESYLSAYPCMYLRISGNNVVFSMTDPLGIINLSI